MIHRKTKDSISIMQMNVMKPQKEKHPPQKKDKEEI